MHARYQVWPRVSAIGRIRSRLKGACELTFDACGICQWAEDVENGAGSKLGAGWATWAIAG